MTCSLNDQVPSEVNADHLFVGSKGLVSFRELPAITIEEVLVCINSSRQRKASDDRREVLLNAMTKFRNALIQYREFNARLDEPRVENEPQLDQLDTETTSTDLEVFFENFFDHPSHRLAVYGTLKPNGSNAAQLAGIEGDWSEGNVHGIVEQPGEYLEFTWDVSAPPVSVMVFSGPRLNEHFDRLDDFEGPDYQRTLVPVDIDGMIHVCNIYEGKRRKKTHA